MTTHLHRRLLLLVKLPLGQLLGLLLVLRNLRLQGDLPILPLGQLLLVQQRVHRLQGDLQFLLLLQVKQPKDLLPLRRVVEVQLLQLVRPMH